MLGIPRPPALGAAFSASGGGDSTASIFLPVGIAVCMKIRSPQTIGEDVPDPGTATFHLTFLASPHSSGGWAVVEAPLASGPRHCGQNRCESLAVGDAAGPLAAFNQTPTAENRTSGIKCPQTANDWRVVMEGL